MFSRPTLAKDIKCNTDVDYKRFMEDPITIQYNAIQLSLFGSL